MLQLRDNKRIRKKIKDQLDPRFICEDMVETRVHYQCNQLKVFFAAAGMLTSYNISWLNKVKLPMPLGKLRIATQALVFKWISLLIT